MTGSWLHVNILSIHRTFIMNNHPPRISEENENPTEHGYHATLTHQQLIQSKKKCLKIYPKRKTFSFLCTLRLHNIVILFRNPNDRDEVIDMRVCSVLCKIQNDIFTLFPLKVKVLKLDIKVFIFISRNISSGTCFNINEVYLLSVCLYVCMKLPNEPSCFRIYFMWN